jgi:hypothetical protein
MRSNISFQSLLQRALYGIRDRFIEAIGWEQSI